MRVPLALALAFWMSRPPAAVPSVLICDVDGTLLPWATSRGLSRRNAEALRAAHARGCRVVVATGRMPGPWYDALRGELPGVLEASGVFGNGALVQVAGAPRSERLPALAVRAVVRCLRGQRLVLLAATRLQGGYGYRELGREETWATAMIRGAGEAIQTDSFEALEAEEVFKFVIFTRNEEGWAQMADVVPLLREKLKHSGVTVLDCGGGQCEVFPPGVNKGGTGQNRWDSASKVASEPSKSTP